MNIFVYGLALYFIAFLIHIIFWRIYVPRNQVKALLNLFFLVLIIGIFIFWKLSGSINFFGITACLMPYDYIQLSFLYISLALAYIVSFVAVEVGSPSLLIVLNIAQAGPGGLDKEALEQKMEDDALITERVSDLAAGGFVDFDGRIYRINSKGKLIAQIFIIFRKLLRAQKGG